MPPDFVACTVASRRYLPQARVMADSFFAHHPGGRFALLVPDEPDGAPELDERIEVLRPGDVGVEPGAFHRMALMYTGGELACALKAWLLSHLVARGDTAVLVDGDMLVLGDLSELAAAAERAGGTALTPHCLVPHAEPGAYPPMIGWAPRRSNAFGAEQTLIRAGTYNAGLMGVAAGAEPFLDWWREREARYGVLEPHRALFADQGWLALVPTLFDVEVLRDPGLNVNAYHLGERDLEWEGDVPSVGGAPVRCFHFITFDPLRPDRLTYEPNIARVWPALSERPGAARLCREYSERVRAAGAEEARAEPGRYDRLPGGTPVDANMRAAYREALLRAEAGEGPEPPNPFDSGDADAFLEWLDGPWDEAAAGPPVSRCLVGLHTRLDWVYGAHKDVPGEDSLRFLHWVPGAVERGDVEVGERWIPDTTALPELPADPAMEDLRRQYRELAAALEAHRSSLVWRATAPLRRAAARVRGRT